MLARKHKISLPRVLSKLLQSLHTVHHDVLCGDLAMRTMTFSQNRDKVLRAQVSLLRLRLSSNMQCQRLAVAQAYCPSSRNFFTFHIVISDVGDEEIMMIGVDAFCLRGRFKS